MRLSFRAVAIVAAFLTAAAITNGADPTPKDKGQVVFLSKSAKLMKATGDAVTVKAGDFADFTIDVPEGTSIIADIMPEPPKLADGLPNGRFIFSGVPGTKYTVYCTLIDFKAGKATKARYTASFEGAAPVVVDDKKPKPVTPVTPVVTIPAELQKAVLSAWTKESEADRKLIPELAKVFANCVNIVDNHTTRADLRRPPMTSVKGLWATRSRSCGGPSVTI